MTDIHEARSTILGRVEAAALRVGRSPADVRVIAVSKFQPDELVRDAWADGQRDFAENYAQDLRDRAARLVDLEGARWHAIGPLQQNKVKYVAKVASSFHALERLDVAEELSRRRVDDPIEALVQIHLGDEETKAGIEAHDLPAFLASTRQLPGLRVVGLMAMPPLEDAEAARPWFRVLRELAANNGLPRLSMGTTADFEVAIEEGATDVRIGRSIFGPHRPRIRPER